METTPLFERLGGSPGIHALVEDIVARHMENPTIKARYRPLLETPDRLEEVKNHLRTFLEEGSGGTARYTGRDMRETHRGMNISAEEYMAAVDDILEALRKHRADEQTRKDVLAIAFSLKDEILHL